ncbi:cobyrinic acid a,c-diamide synthase [Alkalicoccus urumqiensis]|uniref:Cobyrinic acid a,c-diamide synthase n=2 Tax=Alkalicoccus urumqiensis TaxID=1548213 RepID=A0A2P6MGB5_ALKUR|nr:cobyrinic acid a,c-diamide synthase [Alkalicoccus urumqiensis]
MMDQAQALRQKLKQSQDKKAPVETKVVSVVSGKGGVGKSNVAVNLALELKKQNKEVLIIDLDIGMANIDILIGESSTSSIVDMLEKGESIWNVIQYGPESLAYVAGGSGLNSLFELNEQMAETFTQQLESLNGAFDYIFLDMGAGVSNDSLHFLLSAQECILVTTPEPTSMTDAYAMIKYLNMYEKDLPVSIIVNRANNERDGEKTAENLMQVTKKFLKKDVHFLGSIPNDPIVWKAVRAQTPFTQYAPSSKPSKAVKKAAGDFSGSPVSGASSFNSFIGRLKKYMKGESERS